MKRGIQNVETITINDYFLPDDLYESIMIYSDINNIKKLATLNSQFYNISSSPYFWEKKINLDFPGVLNPDDDDEYTMNHYESIQMSYEEAVELLNHKTSLIVFSSNPWHDDHEKLYNVKIKKHKNHYDLLYKIYTEEGMEEISKSLCPRETVLLVTLYIYYQNVRFQGNIDI
jgi:hypothetical protein